MANEIHVSDIGTQWRVTITNNGSAMDISSASTKELIFLKPNQATLTKTASFYTDGTDGIITYTSVSGDLSMAGLWRLQGHIVLGTTNWKTEITPFIVYPNI